MCIGSSAPAPAPLPPVVRDDPKPAPILKLRTDDGAEEVVDAEDVQKDKGTTSLSIPGAKKKNPAVSV